MVWTSSAPVAFLPMMPISWIDGHLDLAYLAAGGRDLRVPVADPAAGCVSLPALRSAAVKIVFGTIFTEPGAADASQPHIYDAHDVDAAEAAGLLQMKIYERWQADGEIAIVRKARDLDAASAALQVVLLMEGADPIRSADDVRAWYDRGLRIVGLTWAAGTRFAGGNSAAPGTGGLTPRGIELLHALDDVAIIHDASHLSDAAFDGLLSHARGRIIASHSNCRALLEPKQRHLRDDQIRAVADRGGIIGLNLYSSFLARGGGGGAGRRATVADCVAHLDHVAEVIGHRRAVALGSDMDGGFGPDCLPHGLDHPSKLVALAAALSDANWSDEEIEGFAYSNWRGFLNEAL